MSDEQGPREGPSDAAEATEVPEGDLTLMENLRLLWGSSRGYWAVNIVNFGDGIGYFGVLNLLVLFLGQDVGMGTASAHIAVSSFTGIVTVGMFLGGGFVSDWLGVRRALTLALGMVLIGRVILVLAPGLGEIGSAVAGAWTSLVVMGIAEAIIQPALYAGVKEYSDKRTATMGYAIIYAVMNLGIVVESLMSPLVRDVSREWEGTVGNPAGGISGMYWVLIAGTGLLLALHLVLFTKKVEERDRIVEEPSAEEEAHQAKSLWEKVKDAPVLDKRFLFFIFVLLPVRTLFAHQWLTMPEYIMRCFPAGVGERYEWISAINPLIIVIGVPLIAAWTRKVNIITMMIIGTLISALSTSLLLPEPALALLVAYVVCFSLGEAAWSSRFLEYVAGLAPAGRVGAYMGVATLPWFLAKATTGWYSGAVLDRFVPVDGVQDPSTMWLIYGAVALISPIGLILARRWVEGGVHQQPEQEAA
ncbi:MAG: MFS transporter [Deltaproteobacteria bacterium]|nr:MFS transporter [Deltaproteobacteria bacterium]